MPKASEHPDMPKVNPSRKGKPQKAKIDLMKAAWLARSDELT
jgi:hypothetical protein